MSYRPQGQFTERRQIPFAEEPLQREPCALGWVHFAASQPFPELLRRHVDQDHFIGLFDHPVRHPLAHDRARDTLDEICQTLDMLNVQGTENGNACVEDVQHILPTFRILPTAGNVRMGEFIDERHRRMTSQERIEIEFFDEYPAIRTPLPRQDR
ncbi:hypothetical protein HRbin27_01932 [bacterium HR27]|nr:hypothetical protein HRbin27_01932 [bacterium HR27]